MVCKFIDTNGTHLRIFTFEVETGLIGTGVLREQIVGDVNKDIEEVSNESDGRDEDDEVNEDDNKVNQILDLKDKNKLHFHLICHFQNQNQL